MTTYTWNGGIGAWTDPADWTPNGVTLWNENDGIVIKAGTVVLHNIEPNSLTINFGASTADAQPDITLNNAALGPETKLDLMQLNGAASFGILTVQGWDTNYGSILLGGKEVSPGILTIDLPRVGYGQLNQEGTITVLDNSYLAVTGSNSQPGVLNNDGTVLIAGAAANIDSEITGSGTITLDQTPGFGYARVTLGAGVGSQETVNLTAGHLVLDQPMQFLGTIENWTDPQSSLALQGEDLVSAVFRQTTATAGDLLLYGQRGAPPVLDLKVAGHYAAHAFGVTDNAITHTSVVALVTHSGPPAGVG